jgi:putative spermidine/putrescine transport system permease protein
VSSYGWVVLLGNQGVVNTALTKLGLVSQPLTMLYTDVSLVVGLVHVLLPFMVLSLSAALERIDPLLTEAAMTLGATRARVWRHVLLPLALPGIGSGATIVFALAMSSYVTPAVLGPSGPNFVTTLIYQYFISLYDWATGSALAVTLLVVSMASVAAYGAVISRFSFAEGRRA